MQNFCRRLVFIALGHACTGSFKIERPPSIFLNAGSYGRDSNFRRHVAVVVVAAREVKRELLLSSSNMYSPLSSHTFQAQGSALRGST